MIIIPILSFMMSQSVFAYPKDSLIKAQNLDELMKLESSLDRLDQLTQGCKIETQKKMFPLFCLELLDRDFKSLGVENDLSARLGLLSEQCIENVSELQSEESINKVLGRTLLPRGCRKALVDRLADLTYIRGSD